MGQYASNFAITNPILGGVATIMEKVGSLSDSQALSQIKERAMLKPCFLPKDPFDPVGYLAEAKTREKTVKDISPLLKKLFLWAKKSQATMNPLLLSAVFTYMLTALGPLKKGNEELALSYGKAVLAPYRKIFGYLPYETRVLSNPKASLKALHLSSDSGDCGPYILFLFDQIAGALDDARRGLRSITKEQTELEKKLLSIMRPKVSYSSKEIMLKLGLKSRVATKRNYLEPAIKDGLIKMTLPSKINSPLQRYIKK